MIQNGNKTKTFIDFIYHFHAKTAISFIFVSWATCICEIPLTKYWSRNPVQRNPVQRQERNVVNLRKTVVKM